MTKVVRRRKKVYDWEVKLSWVAAGQPGTRSCSAQGTTVESVMDNVPDDFTANPDITVEDITSFTIGVRRLG